MPLFVCLCARVFFVCMHGLSYTRCSAEVRRAVQIPRLETAPPRFCPGCGSWDTMVEVPNQLGGVKTVVTLHGVCKCGVPVHACSICGAATLQAVTDYAGNPITSDRPVFTAPNKNWGWHYAATGSMQYFCATPTDVCTLVAAEVCQLGHSCLLKGLSSTLRALRARQIWLVVN